MTERKRNEHAPQRKERLGAALKENLKRRKAQARSRAALREQPEEATAADRKAGEGGFRR